MNKELTGGANYRQQHLQEHQQQQQHHSYYGSPPNGTYAAAPHIGAINAQEQPGYFQMNSQQSDMFLYNHWQNPQPLHMQQSGYPPEQLQYHGQPQPQLHAALEMLVQQNGLIGGLNEGMGGLLHGGAHSDASQLQGVSDVDYRKLVILGLPWDTTENTLHMHFSQFGAVEAALVMKDRYTGKSRGFGFVTFVFPADAVAVVGGEHHVDGRRCEAKFALPRGGANPNRTTRIFVARIPPHVSDDQFRTYFAQHGAVQDAYMPKDASKLGHRGIGFVTFASPDSVEKVMSTTHALNGQELAIDRATPKDKGPPGQAQLAARLGGSQQIGTHSGAGSGFGGYGGANAGSLVPPDSGEPPSLNATRLAAMLTASGYDLQSLLNGGLNAMVAGGGAGLLNAQGSSALIDANGGSIHAHRGDGTTMQPLQGFNLYGGTDTVGTDLGMQLASAQAVAAQLALASSCGRASLQRGASDGPGTALAGGAARSMSGGDSMQGAAASGAVQRLIQGRSGSPAASHGSPSHSGAGRLSMAAGEPEQSSHGPRPPSAAGLSGISGEGGGLPGGGGGVAPSSPTSGSGADGVAAASQGLRIFVGKLPKGTVEGDVKQYFMQFGYVMDVYMPRDKHNRAEHRGFGFVTFETVAAVQRVAVHGSHQINGAVVAVDGAVPRRMDDPPSQEQNDPRPSHSGGSGFNGGGNSDAGGVSTYPVMSAAFRTFALAAEGVGPQRHQHTSSAPRYRPYSNEPAGQ